MTSDKRRAANRANAARSTGPRTPEGKARSAQNAVKHNFAATSFAVIRLEDIEEIGRLKADLVAVYQPVNSQEMIALERVAIAQQALFRVSRLESGFFTQCMNDALGRHGHDFFPMTEDMVSDDIQVVQAQNRNYALANGFERLAKFSNSFTLFLRYQAQTERLYRRAIEDFERLKALRGELPNEPILTTEPELNQPDAADETNPIVAASEASRIPGPASDASEASPASHNPQSPPRVPAPASEASPSPQSPPRVPAPASEASGKPPGPRPLAPGPASEASRASKTENPAALEPQTINNILSAHSRGIGPALIQE